MLGVPDAHVVAMVITFGYPASGRRPPVWAKESMHRGIARTPLSELVRYERW